MFVWSYILAFPLLISVIANHLVGLLQVETTHHASCEGHGVTSCLFLPDSQELYKFYQQEKLVCEQQLSPTSFPPANTARSCGCCLRLQAKLEALVTMD